MKPVLIVALLSGFLSLPAYAALKSGVTAPDFSAQASLAGKEFTFSLKETLKKGPAVIYFYPAAYTGGCNLEAHTFAENKARFDLAGATIIGVSRDSIKQLNDFSADPQYCAGKFPVASDPDGAIARSYDLQVMNLSRAVKTTRGENVDHALTERTTFVITPDSKIVATLSSADDKISPAEHVERSLAIVESLKNKKK